MIRFRHPIGPQASKPRILDKRILTPFSSRFSWLEDVFLLNVMEPEELYCSD